MAGVPAAQDRRRLAHRAYAAGRAWIDPIPVASIAAALVAFIALLAFGDLPPLLCAPLVLGPAGLTCLAVTYALRIPEATTRVRRAVALARSRRQLS